MNELTVQSLRDICDTAEEVAFYLRGVTLAEYLGDRGQQLQIERLLEIFGEAVNRAVKSDPALREHLVEWRSITGMRNRISHGYDAIDDEIIWSSATYDVPMFHEKALGLLRGGGYSL